MPHKCARCGKVSEASKESLLEGCPECGGKKFFFLSGTEVGASVPPDTPGKETCQSPGHHRTNGAGGANTEKEPQKSPECIKIIGPGTYELNIEKMAESEERVDGYHDEGTYFVDLFSMARKGKKHK